MGCHTIQKSLNFIYLVKKCHIPNTDSNFISKCDVKKNKKNDGVTKLCEF